MIAKGESVLRPWRWGREAPDIPKEDVPMAAAYRLLVVEDEKPIAELLEYGLRQEGVRCARGPQRRGGYAADGPGTAGSDPAGLDAAGLQRSGLVPPVYGKIQPPLILLTARSHMDDKVQGLESGADDYVTKPFEMRELLARVRSVLRRAEKYSRTEPPLRLPGGLQVSTQERTVTLQGKPLELTPREFELLVFLLRHPHRVFTREELLEQLWEYPCPVDTRTVDTHIQRLRKKLSGAAAIETVFGVGYKYVPEG